MKQTHKITLVLALIAITAIGLYPFTHLFFTPTEQNPPSATLILLTGIGGFLAAITNGIAIRTTIASRRLRKPLIVIITIMSLLAVGYIASQYYINTVTNPDCFTPQPGLNYTTTYVSDSSGHYCWIKPVPDSPLRLPMLILLLDLVMSGVLLGLTILVSTLLGPKKSS